MNLIRKLVYGSTETALENEYDLFKKNLIVKTYKNFALHMERNWERRREWAVCFRDNTYMRGIETTGPDLGGGGLLGLQPPPNIQDHTHWHT